MSHYKLSTHVKFMDKSIYSILSFLFLHDKDLMKSLLSQITSHEKKAHDNWVSSSY